MDALTMKPEERSADIAVKPIVPILKNYYGLVPSVVLAANAPRNLLVLAARRFQPAYSVYTSGREAQIIAHFAPMCRDRVIATNVHLPQDQGRQLPDIDVLLRGITEGSIILVEIKWQLSASDTKEVVARNDYLKKGQEQLFQIREYIARNPGYLRQRGLVDFDTPAEALSCMLLCKGHLGSADVIASHSIMADYDIFTTYLRSESFERALERVTQYDYLPIPERDFILDEAPVKFGEWRIKWKYFRSPETIPDDEASTLRGMYAATHKYVF